MDYINQKIQKWMPQERRIAVKSDPSMHGIADSINSTLATPGSHTKLPPEFYDSKLRKIVDQIVVEEEYSGYKESTEYRALGIGDLAGEIVTRMVDRARVETSGDMSKLGRWLRKSKASSQERMALFGCHDATIAALMASLGVLEGENGTWPAYGSTLAVELFTPVKPTWPNGQIRHVSSQMLIKRNRKPKQRLKVPPYQEKHGVRGKTC